MNLIDKMLNKMKTCNIQESQKDLWATKIKILFGI